MDRLDAMALFVAVVDEGSLARGGRRLGKSPAAVSRALGFLEARLGAPLLVRTTRSLRLTERGEAYLGTCRAVLEQIEEAELGAAGDRAAPRGLLTVTAPRMFGRLKVRPQVDAFLDRHAAVQVRLLLLDRVVNVIDEGIDLAVRIGHLPDSSLVALKVGEVSRIVCASPAYLARVRPPREPADLAALACIAFTQITPSEVWSFGPGSADGRAERLRQVRVQPRLTVNSADAALASALEGKGLTCVLSYQAEAMLADGRLQRVLTDWEPAPLPVHVVFTRTRLATAKTRGLVDFLVPALRAELGYRA
ncbi:LysR family transcriptional regulator [Derxia lacustris]|uniref:LysR family transcriptional regulator n=1 Tax=Derxia lacustris TaxID=764842 RepID=UPI000A171D56|nr:LysR family transcriptional regulator [Derxia lacustris]